MQVDRLSTVDQRIMMVLMLMVIMMLLLVMVSGDTGEIAFLNALVQHVLRRYQKLFEILLKSCKEILCKNFLALADWPYINNMEQNQAIRF